MSGTRHTLTVPSELLDAIAERVAELVAARIGMDPVSPWLTVGEAAEYLRWPKSRVQKLTAAKAIPHAKHEGRVLFNRGELDVWLRDFHEGPRLPS